MNVEKPAIYQIVNLDNGKRYIGSAVCVHCRFCKHKKQLRTGTHHNRYLQRAWDKHGEKRFLFDVIKIVPKDKLREQEQMWIDSSGCTDKNRGYNLASDARSNRGYEWTEEQKARLKAKWDGKRKVKIAKAKYIPTFIGKKHSEATKEKMRVAQLGHSCSLETKTKIGNANRGKVRTEEVRKKLSASHLRRA